MEFSKKPTPRLEVKNMKSYQAPLEGRRNFLRLDFNENTIGPSPLVIEALKNIPSNHISIYPEYQELKESLTNHLNKEAYLNSLTINQVGIFNGVDAAIHAIFHAFGDRNDPLLTTEPTFGYYSPCAQMQGMEIIKIPYEGDNLDFPCNRIEQVIQEKKPKLLFICNPNNPTGTIVKPEILVKLAKQSPSTLIVIDELYEAFTGSSVLPIIDFNLIPNIVVLRSFSKTSGLAGLRIGFAIGEHQVIDYINRVTGPYDINSFAITAALAALKDTEYTDNYITEVLKAKEWIKNKLSAQNIKHIIGGGNYFLVWPEKGSMRTQELLKEDGILVRDMSNKVLIHGSLRVSIGTRMQMEDFWRKFELINHS